ncbi:MAG: Holliday junction resolvase RuvX [Thiomargarita sp.]|nr:Holliday junction resolvase RuvX [Thiomargarita sp.]
MYIMAFDYGTKRIGVAIGQTFIATARPLTIVLVRNKKIDWVKINQLVNEWKPKAFVVGLPQLANGSSNYLIKSIQHFSQQLQQRYQFSVHLVDERLSSIEAAERGTKDLDAIAAQIILETWFNQ